MHRLVFGNAPCKVDSNFLARRDRERPLAFSVEKLDGMHTSSFPSRQKEPGMLRRFVKRPKLT